MDLISSITLLDIVAGVSAFWLFGMVSTMFFQVFHSNPLVQTLVNTTLAVLKTTEVVWRPFLNASLVILKPVAAFAVQILKPFGPLALILADSIVRGMVIFGYVTTMAIIEGIQLIRQCFRTLQSAGMSVSAAVSNAYEVTKDFAFSLATLVKAFTYFTIRLVNTASYIVTSFEKVGDFLYNLIFEAHKVTWDDVYAITLPFLIVASIVGYVLWRGTTSCRKQRAYEKKCEDLVVPRRSSRLARKRAMLLAGDASVLARCEPTPTAANL